MAQAVPPAAVVRRSSRPGAPVRWNFAILTHGALDATRRCLRTLAATVGEPFRVFVVDNASTDGTQQWLASRTEPWLHWQWNAHNRGVPGGRNDLLEFALPHLRDTDWLVFCDNDLEFEPGWLDAFTAAMAAWPQARLLGKVGHFVEVRGDRRVLLPAPTRTGPVDVLSGGFACCVRADAAAAIGPFDERLGLFWHEDDDWCVRALQLGCEVVAVPEAAVLHHEHASGVANAGLREGGSLQNQAWLAQKWRDAGWVDDGGWIRRPAPGVWQPPEVRSELQRRGAFGTSVGRAEFAAAWALLDRLVGAADARAEFVRRREPVPRALPALLAWNRECAQAGGANDLVRALDAVAAALAAERFAVRLAGVVDVPEQSAGATGNGLCAAADFDDPQWLAVADEFEPGHCARDPSARERSLWEQVSGLLALQREGVFRPGARVLVTGEPRPRFEAWLQARGLAVTRWDAFAAPSDQSCDAAVLQRTLDPDFVARVRACVVPDGVFVFVGDAVLDGAPTRAAPVPMQIEHDLLARAGLQACATVRTAVDADVLEACIDRSAPPERRPQLCTARDGRLSTSFVVAARVRAPAAVRAAPPAVLVPALPPQPATLRVAVDLRTVAYADSSARGIGQYTVHHLAAVARRDATVQLCCHLPDAIALPRQLELPNVTRRDVDAFAARDCDVVHLPDPMNLTLGFDSPLRTFRHERTTVTFHDLTPLRHYLQAWPERNRLAYLDRLRQIERSDALLLCNSTFTRDDVVATLGIAARRARVILAGCNGGGAPSAADAAAVRRRLGLRGPFVLHVGALDPHKNFAATLSAFLQVRRARELQLVVVGAVDPGIEYFASFCKSRGVRDVVFTGFLPRADLDALYAAAAGLLFLSRSEGFGFPLLEAMAAGCPVVGTDATSHPEVVGDAGQLVPIDDTVAAAAALERLLADAPFAAQCRARGRARARSFTWDAVADRTLAAWRAMGGVASAVDVTAPAIVAAP